MPIEYPFFYNHIYLKKNLNNSCDIDISQFTCRVLNSVSTNYESCPQVLIISDIYDHESDKIGRLLAENKIEYARINSKYITNNLSINLSIDNEKNTCHILSHNHSFNCSSVKVVLFRNFNVSHYRTYKNKVADAIFKQEWQASILSLLSISNAEIINKIEVEEKLNSPFYQLLKARESGFLIPKTLITTSLQNIKEFVGNHPENYIIKAIGLHHTVENGVRHSYFLHCLVDVWESLKQGISAPVLIQEKISSKADMRLTFIGDYLFFTKIERSAKFSDCIDYHYLNLNELIYSEFKASFVFEQKCRVFIKNIGLFYGSIDFVYRDLDDFIFLEVNSCPDWHWLNNIHSLSITKAFIESIKLLL